MKCLNFILILPVFFHLSSFVPISVITDSYEGRPHFRIETGSAVYYYDKSGGGFSRMIDADGNDWINYNGNPDAAYPYGASGGFRGIPNLVYGSDDGGAGHPGFDKCISKLIDENTIRSSSKSGKWEWEWSFYDDYATLAINKTDPKHNYWFLYEGPVAGSFSPEKKYWGTDSGGPRYETPSLNSGEYILGNWQWAYFGDVGTDRIFFVAQDKSDEFTDHFAYMGETGEGIDAPDGMVVFGFGRDKSVKPIMFGTNVSFFIGFIDKHVVSAEDHELVKLHISKLIGK